MLMVEIFNDKGYIFSVLKFLLECFIYVIIYKHFMDIVSFKTLNSITNKRGNYYHALSGGEK